MQIIQVKWLLAAALLPLSTTVVTPDVTRNTVPQSFPFLQVIAGGPLAPHALPGLGLMASALAPSIFLMAKPNHFQNNGPGAQHSTACEGENNTVNVTETTPVNQPAMSYPVPMPAFAMPPFPPVSARGCGTPGGPKCPICPPCSCDPCTPSFFSFCSPCHMRCRCRDEASYPQPIPIPGMNYPRNMLPAPIRIFSNHFMESVEEEYYSTSSSSESDSSERRGRKRRYRNSGSRLRKYKPI